MRDLFGDLFGRPFGIVLYQLLEATQFTIYLSLIAFLGGGLVALIITLARVSPSKTAKVLTTGYIWVFQSVPLLMLLFLLGLGVPRLLGVNIDPWIAASIALIVYTSAYLSDVWCGAVEAIPEGQWEAGRVLGLRFLPTVGLIILPQTFRLSLAPTVGFMVQIIKGTSLAFIIGFHDLMNVGKRWANAPVEGTEAFVIYPLMALIYFALCFPLSVWSRRLERRLGSAANDNAPVAA
ncbi:MAG: amino acid ABC transporter permease [Pseudomonadota bacterium]